MFVYELTDLCKLRDSCILKYVEKKYDNRNHHLIITPLIGVDTNETVYLIVKFHKKNQIK